MGKPNNIMPPYNREAEEAILGAILVRPVVLDGVVDLLQPADFYREAHGRIYQVMMGLYNRNDPVDLVTVTARLKEVGWLEGCGGVLFLAGLSEQVGFATNALYYAKLVSDKAKLRRLLDATQEIAGACLGQVDDVDTFLELAETRMFQLVGHQQIQAQALSELVPPEMARIEALHDNRGQPLGLASGFQDMDRLTGGFQDSDLIILAARPSMGKTALALNIAHYAAVHQSPGAFFSLEMSKEQLVRRLMSSVGRINSERLRTGRMDDEEWAVFTRTGGHLMDTPIFISDKPTPTPMEIRSQARRLKAKHGIKWVIVDYMQLIGDSRVRSREQEVAGISRALKALAKELSLPVIALSQLNRKVEERTDKRPILSDLRESGAIEQDADLIFFIYRDEVYHEDSNKVGIAEIELAKNRNGPTGKFALTFLRKLTRFENYQLN